jgi:hypothetical protein
MALEDRIKMTEEMLTSGFIKEKEYKKFIDKWMSDHYDYELLKQQKQAFTRSSLTIENIKESQRKLEARRKMYKITVILPPTVTWRDRLMTMEVSQLEQTFRYSMMKPIDYHSWTPERLGMQEPVEVLNLQARRIAGTVYTTY